MSGKYAHAPSETVDLPLHDRQTYEHTLEAGSFDTQRRPQHD